MPAVKKRPDMALEINWLGSLGWIIMNKQGPILGPDLPRAIKINLECPHLTHTHSYFLEGSGTKALSSIPTSQSTCVFVFDKGSLPN